MKKIFIAAMAAAVAFTLTGCKGTNEKRGDEHLKEGRYRNAINSYLEAKKKGKMSDEFFDNFTLALVRAGDAESKKDLSSDLINNYFEKAAVNIPQVKENSTIEEYAKTLAEIGKRQAAQEGVDFATIINAFAKIDSAESVAKLRHIAEPAIKAIREETEKLYVARNLSEATGEEDPVVSEYLLLRMAEMAPNNAEIQAALNKSRKTTRGYFLIFGENIPDLSGKQRVDKWGYVMAFPTIKITPNSLSGELQFWASTGNNTELDPAGLKLVSTSGESVAVKAGGGWCEAEVLVGKKGDEKIEKKKKNFKPGTKGKLMNEFQCSLNVTFNYGKGFVPDYVEYKDQYGIGRKYLGH